jgi:hypothetical protein
VQEEYDSDSDMRTECAISHRLIRGTYKSLVKSFSEDINIILVSQLR